MRHFESDLPSLCLVAYCSSHCEAGVVLFYIQILLPSFPAPSLTAWTSANLGRLAQLDRHLFCGRLQIQTPVGPSLLK